MNVLTILGSPRDQGNTAQCLAVFEGALSAAGHSVERVNLSKLNISGCKECMTCQKPGKQGTCSIRDDMSPLYAKVEACDVLVMATPVFMWSYTAQAKAFMDRLFCFSTPEGIRLAGKKTALILTGGGDAFDGADLVAAGFMKFAFYNKMIHVGQVASAPMLSSTVEPHVRAALEALANAIAI